MITISTRNFVLRASDVFLVALFATGNAQGGSAPAVIQGSVPASDGVSIAYDVRGKGDTSLVFVHCWACDRSFWHNQLDVFAENYKVVSLDLGGHGASGTDRRAWTILGLAGDVQAVVESLGLKRVILVGHSMGGPVSLEAARRMSGRVVSVILVDTIQNAEVGATREQADKLGTQLQADFKNTMGEFVRAAFTKEADPKVVDWAVSKASSANRQVALALLRDFPNLNLQQLLGSVKVPVRGLNSAPPMGPPTAVDVNRKYADYDAVILQDVGHFMMLERPDAFNAQLAKLLKS
jgi:pimeloyl-ACP methyl ester carboxylesterase